MIIREQKNEVIVSYELSVDSKSLLEIQKDELQKIENQLKCLRIMSSWGDIMQFYNFINMDVHKSYDFYFNQSIINSGGNDYMVIEELDGYEFENKSIDFEKPFKNTFSVIGNTFGSREVFNNEDISHSQTVSHYAIFGEGRIFYGGSHVSVGYHLDTVMQIPKILYIADKILKLKLHLISKEIQYPYFDSFLDLMTAQQIGTQKTSDIRMQFNDGSDHRQHINKITEDEGLVLALKKAGRIKH